MSDAKISLPLLDRVKIATPCSANWDEMQGDQRKRFCQQCNLNVYDLSRMTAADAEALLQAGTQSGERTCIRLYRRHDGRVITQDCPVGLRRVRLQAVRSVAAIIAFIFSGLAMATAGTRLSKWVQQARQSSTAVVGRLAPPTMPSTSIDPSMGDMVVMGGMQCPPE